MDLTAASQAARTRISPSHSSADVGLRQGMTWLQGCGAATCCRRWGVSAAPTRSACGLSQHCDGSTASALSTHIHRNGGATAVSARTITGPTIARTPRGGCGLALRRPRRAAGEPPPMRQGSWSFWRAAKPYRHHGDALQGFRPGGVKLQPSPPSLPRFSGVFR